jgi:hypothetical protein
MNDLDISLSLECRMDKINRIKKQGEFLIKNSDKISTLIVSHSIYKNDSEMTHYNYMGSYNCALGMTSGLTDYIKDQGKQ